ncbi:MAG: CcoQ/FixQ family Cbb3-type cytochrome c oxidase assembly chaperone [Rhodospirillales bacterium]|jgi:cbb3-type cytochrome oxidase subunit 3
MAPEAGSSIDLSGVIWMIVLFAGILFWAFHPKNRHRYRHDLDDRDRDDERKS